ncbi:cell wall metabolism sensor histidine kinase WalK [Caldilinea sp.]|uniref:sensor histidine kinase n=1 Tax=Caldilinea sp. TaxID=2293560 RepID=UPI0021DE643F|nr:heavy metal sensor histidine kinase [Caldilinea sp.]GIV68238.1 MAG: two-component sensor histidine kinase [Caldilinea sp.]
MIKTLRLRMALLTGALAAAVTLLFGAYLYFTLRIQLLNALDDALRASATQFMGMLEQEDGRLGFAQGDLVAQRSTPREDVIRLVAPDGRILDQIGAVDAPVLASTLQPEGGVYTYVVAGDATQSTGEATGDVQQIAGETLRLLSWPVRLHGQTVAYLQVGRSLESVEEALNALLFLLLVGAPFMLGAGIGGGYWLAGRTLAPIDAIRRKAAEISAQDLSQRLALNLPDDEVGRLARTFDEMLARLDDAFQRQRRFVSDASHELRTPLTIVMGEIEVALAQPRAPEAYVQTLSSVYDEVERMRRLTNDLLLLARSDSGRLQLTRTKLDLSELIASLCEQMEPRIGEAGIDLRLELTSPLWVEADFDRLLQLFSNLLDNAIVYAPGSPLTIKTLIQDENAVAVIADAGPGIPPEHLPHIFDRFYRADPARSSDNSGLGLSIAFEIARAHGGDLQVQSAPGQGATFILYLPRTQKA